MFSMSGARRTAGRLVAPVVLVVVAGCSVMSKEQCQVADWRELGLSDASAGKGRGRLKERGDACARHGTNPDQAAYGAGYAEGQRLYCTASRGRTLAQSGDAVPEVCEGLGDAVFSNGYQAGLLDFCTFDGGLSRGRSGLDYLGQCPAEAVDKVKVGIKLGKELNYLDLRLQDVARGQESAMDILRSPKASDAKKQEAERRLVTLNEEEDSIRRRIRKEEARAAQLR